jgi:hypothetical protein
MPAILTIVANVPNPGPTVQPQVSTVPANVVIVGPDFTAVRTQLLLRRAFPLVLAIFANIVATIYYVASNVVTIGADIFGIRPNLPAIGSQFSSFPAIDSPLGRGCGCACKNCGQQQNSSQKCSLHFLLLF